ncbi:CDP-alcohol phosphatidyltransferase family protein [Treponema putidum]|uniref:CDP-alcohol phosphatidyltransferase n=1 Tax=Treponema putidum TaxID=221027 RepID=A0ABY5HYI6_9SPIR|nr:CDP-alcohol phosphatidyltransferase family protein [Treponema putidum]UTY29868.1 CDP-alcohol phosphatidyltransferase [Treponema putidum]UTY32320.1 CDP-alcohol phosphatidyltransferase [Treponema putidum]
MENYSYSAEDKSLLTPLLYKYFVFPLVRILPESIPANIITVFSNSFILISFFIAYINYLQDTYKFLWLIPVLCWLYIVGDCSDGVQARRTKTGSPLGEYLDHFLDSFVTGFLTGILMLCFRVTNPILLFCVYQFLYLGQIGTFWGRFKNGVMQFAAFSTSEGIMAISLMSALASVGFIREASVKNILFGVSIPYIIIFAGFGAAWFTGLTEIFKTKRYSICLFLHIVFSALIGAVLVWYVKASIFTQTVIITFYNVLFIQSVLSATAEKLKESFPDFLVPLSCLLYFIFFEYSIIISIIQGSYLLVRIVIRFLIFFKKYKHCWYWKNPLPTKK